jgi:hypothetical protein
MNFNAARFLDHYNVPYDVNDKGWLELNCPYGCRSVKDSSKKLGAFTPNGIYTCWKCGSNKTLDVIHAITGCGKDKARAIFAEFSGSSSVPVVGRGLEKKHRTDVIKIDLPGSDCTSRHRKYIRSRGFIPSEIIRRYHLRGTGPHEWPKNRIIIPVIQNGKPVSWQARDITGKSDIRYLTLKNDESVIPCKDTLYGIDDVDGGRIAVVEGPIDVWRMGPGFVATYGTSLTQRQIHELSRFREILFLFDPEEQAHERSLHSAKELAAIGRYVEVIQLGTETDPGDMSESEAVKIRREIFSRTWIV